MSFGGESGIDFGTARGRDWPSVRQFNVFLENRVGALLDVVRRFEGTGLRIVSLTVVDLGDCAVVRLVLNDPERAMEVLRLANLSVTETDLVVVELPESQHPLLEVCKALLMAELNLSYAYPLLVGPTGRNALALHVDDHEMAVRTLTSQGFTLLTENDLNL